MYNITYIQYVSSIALIFMDLLKYHISFIINDISSVRAYPLLYYSE